MNIKNKFILNLALITLVGLVVAMDDPRMIKRGDILSNITRDKSGNQVRVFTGNLSTGGFASVSIVLEGPKKGAITVHQKEGTSLSDQAILKDLQETFKKFPINKEHEEKYYGIKL